MKPSLTALLFLVIFAGTAAAQELPSQPSTPESKISFSLRYEWQRDRFRYRFESPSTFDTGFLVPHVMEQTYRSDNQWTVISAHYRFLGSLAETEFGMTPHRGNVGMDYDTFFQPDGNVVLYGTTAGISERSHRFSQRMINRKVRADGTPSAWALRVGYSYQRDHSIMYPSFSSTTQSKPPSFSQFWNPGRETTVSSVHEFTFGASRDFAPSPAWQITALADVSPMRLAHLLTLLPDKYPGEDIVFVSKGFSLASRVVARRALGPRKQWTLELSLAHYETWNYRSSDQFHRSALSGGIAIRFALP